METICSIFFSAFFFTCQFIILLGTSAPTTLVPSTTMIYKKHQRFTTKIIHRDSIFSPYYNPNESIADRANRALKGSIARLAYVSEQALGVELAQTSTSPSESNELFYVKFSIGKPLVPQIAVMDTGSSILWVKCKPCTPCTEKSGSIFDPNKSSTFVALSCKKHGCSDCSSTDKCTYNVSYVNGPSSHGILAMEQFTFQTEDDGVEVLPNIEFGCGRKNGDMDDGQYTGVFALGNAHTGSLINKLDKKAFSYCIGNMMDHQYKFNQLFLGHSARLEGYSTPLATYNGLYYVTLEGISIGDRMLQIDANTFRKTPGADNGVIIDTGTQITWLSEAAYRVIRDEVKVLLDWMLTTYDGGVQGPLCYEGTIGDDLRGFPVLAFNFAKGAEMVLDAQSLFLQREARVFCLAISPTSVIIPTAKDLSIIGMLAQQNYNVGYDLEGHKLYLQRIDCELLED